MKLRQWTLLFLLVGIFVSVVYTQQSNRPLTNNDVIQMGREKVDEEIILRAINTSEINFDISPNGLIQLKKGGVKKRIIEAVQSAQLRKNNQRAAPSNINSRGSIFPDSPPLPSPTPRPTPVATQTAEFFTFELDRCRLSGTSVICYFTVKNNAQDRELSSCYCFPSLVDDVGNTSNTNDAHIGNPNSNVSTSANVLASASVKAWFKFDGISPDARKIGRLKLELAAIPGNIFNVQFRDVPLER
jgi:hypothetical protein